MLMPSAGSVAISYLAGTINTDEILRFKKMVYRATRGKALTYFQEMAASGLHDYAGKQDNRHRSVYVIIFQEGATMRDKLIKICDSFLGKNFDIPPGCEQNEINRLISLLEDRIDDSQKLINQTR